MVEVAEQKESLTEKVGSGAADVLALTCLCGLRGLREP